MDTETARPPSAQIAVCFSNIVFLSFELARASVAERGLRLDDTFIHEVSGFFD
jgi:hypothetical protein